MPGPFDGPVDRATIVRRIETHPIAGEPAAMRAAFERLVLRDDRDPCDVPGGSSVLGSPILAGVDGLTVLPHVDPADAGAAERYAPDRLIVWLHGGGYVFGSPETHARPAARLATLTSTPVLLPRYPLAPEHRWPAPLVHAFGIAARTIDGGARLVLAGDSAGGHLALVASLELASRGTPPAGLLLFSPNTDRTGLSDTREAMTPLDPMNADADDRRLARMCFDDLPDDDPHVSPVLDDLTLLPPTHIEVGDPEVLLGDSLVLHERARAAGANVSLHVEPDLLHMGQLWAPWWDTAEASLVRAAGKRAQVASHAGGALVRLVGQLDPAIDVGDWKRRVDRWQVDRLVHRAELAVRPRAGLVAVPKPHVEPLGIDEQDIFQPLDALVLRHLALEVEGSRGRGKHFHDEPYPRCRVALGLVGIAFDTEVRIANLIEGRANGEVGRVKLAGTVLELSVECY